MRWGFGLFIALLAAPLWASAGEARRWTEKLRQFDRFARVLTLEAWEHRHGMDETNVLLRMVGKLAHIKVRSFDPSETCRDVRVSILEAEKQGAGLIELDLTGNLGGQRMMAVCVVGLFVGPRVVMGAQDVPSPIPEISELVETMPDPGSHSLTWQSSVTDQVTTLPLTIRIDRQTASAAELVAGVLKEYGRGRVVGEKSFGKGTSQDCSPMLKQPNLMVCYTSQRVYLPSGRPLDEGVTPNDFGPVQP